MFLTAPITYNSSQWFYNPYSSYRMLFHSSTWSLFSKLIHLTSLISSLFTVIFTPLLNICKLPKTTQSSSHFFSKFDSCYVGHSDKNSEKANTPTLTHALYILLIPKTSLQGAQLLARLSAEWNLRIISTLLRYISFHWNMKIFAENVFTNRTATKWIPRYFSREYLNIYKQ